VINAHHTGNDIDEHTDGRRTQHLDDQRQPDPQAQEPTVASTWKDIAGRSLTEELLEWPPDVFALTNVVLDRAEGFRFALSAGAVWPPSRFGDWAATVERAGRRWGAWVEDRRAELPKLLKEDWHTVRELEETGLEEIARGDGQRLCEALLNLHAIADEACAGLGVALDTSDGAACVYRARGRELLARTGSLSRLSPRRLRVLPKVRTPPTGRTSFSRYASVHGPGVEARWHKMPARHPGTDVRSEYANLLLLPWPLEVKASDFRPLQDSVQRPTTEPYAFFEYAPASGFDFDLLDRVLVAAREETGAVDVVLLPESAVDESEICQVEALLHRHGVVSLHAGVRRRSALPGTVPGNWLHVGMNPTLEKGVHPADDYARWFHIRQPKHHRWSLDESQIHQYHLGGVLHPSVRWWEGIEIPRREINFVEVAELTLISLVCEDLAQHDDIAQLVRSVGPSLVLAFLLDGPQLNSRWSARYASVLADDPGSAVLTLTSYGMVNRSRPHNHEVSPIVALWRDPARGFREIPLESGAHGIVLTVCMQRATRRSADGRWPVDNGTHVYEVAVHQVRASPAGSAPGRFDTETPNQQLLDVDQLTVLVAWAEAVAEAVAHAPERLPSVLAEAGPGALWRSALELAEPSQKLGHALDRMRQALSGASLPSTPALEATASLLRKDRLGETEIDRLVRRVLSAMIEQRCTRNPAHASPECSRDDDNHESNQISKHDPIEPVDESKWRTVLRPSETNPSHYTLGSLD
jgi:hypothetical protein